MGACHSSAVGGMACRVRRHARGGPCVGWRASRSRRADGLPATPPAGREWVSRLVGAWRGRGAGIRRGDNGLKALKNQGILDSDIVLIHDGARPFVSKEIILNNIKVAKENDAAITVIKSTDSLLMSKTGKVVDSYLDREHIYNCQTPQSFKFSLIFEAHNQARNDGIFDASDDARLVIRMNKNVSLVLGDVNNKKITYKEDLQ